MECVTFTSPFVLTEETNTRRAFVVGNGPSLAETPLDKLIGETSYAVNRINLVFNRTDWRPSVYVRSEGVELFGKPEQELWYEDMKEIVELGIPCYVPKFYSAPFKGYSNVTTLKCCHHYTSNFDDMQAPHNWHLPILCSYGTSLSVAIQLAVVHGYDPIYLIGCDLGYRDNAGNHFDNDYDVGYNEFKQPARYANLNMLTAHINAVRSSPVPIYNATIGGELEVYPRVNFEDLFDE